MIDLLSIPLAQRAPSPLPYVLLMLAGFVVGIAGHIWRSNLLIATGILMIFAATVLLPLIFLSDQF